MFHKSRLMHYMCLRSTSSRLRGVHEQMSHKYTWLQIHMSHLIWILIPPLVVFTSGPLYMCAHPCASHDWFVYSSPPWVVFYICLKVWMSYSSTVWVWTSDPLTCAWSLILLFRTRTYSWPHLCTCHGTPSMPRALLSWDNGHPPLWGWVAIVPVPAFTYVSKERFPNFGCHTLSTIGGQDMWPN